MTAPVTGFALFVLCHYFGRRGRAMARSLAGQVGCPVPLELWVFHSRPEDAALLEEGLAEGPFRLSMTKIQVPPDRIMQRAVHFSEAHQMHGLSHTVFIDADLWFPPDFWARYVAAIEGETPGYWSCRVMNIPYLLAESMLNGWMEISLEKLDQVATGRRLDEQAGRAGHFQCIPKDLTPYPSIPVQSVGHTDTAFSKAAIDLSMNKRTDRRISDVPAYHLGHPRFWEGTRGVEL
jgi:hypothetical protein